jgi:hypothetical protein
MYNMVLYLCVLIVFSLRRESLKLILATDPLLRWFCHRNPHAQINEGVVEEVVLLEERRLRSLRLPVADLFPFLLGEMEWLGRTSVSCNPCVRTFSSCVRRG